MVYRKHTRRQTHNKNILIITTFNIRTQATEFDCEIVGDRERETKKVRERARSMMVMMTISFRTSSWTIILAKRTATTSSFSGTSSWSAVADAPPHHTHNHHHHHLSRHPSVRSCRRCLRPLLFFSTVNETHVFSCRSWWPSPGSWSATAFAFCSCAPGRDTYAPELRSQKKTKQNCLISKSIPYSKYNIQYYDVVSQANILR